MKFGIFYEHQLPWDWDAASEHRLFQESLEQIELADRLGFDYAWEVEHHFMEEYSHSSAPEVFLGAASQRTRNIRLGHGIVQLTTNHPARVAERVATLDLLSNGRVELGLGEGSSVTELHPFNLRFRDKRDIWEDAVRCGYQANPNIAVVGGFMCAPTDEEAWQKADGWTFFQFALRLYNKEGPFEPGSVNMWRRYQEWRQTPAGQKRSGSELIGSPETIRQRLLELKAANVDQVVLLNQAGKNSHEDICSSLKLFAEEVMPEFQAGQAQHEQWKAAVLNGELELEDIDTEPYNTTSHQAPSQRPSREDRDMVAGVVGRPGSTAVNG